MNVSVSYPKFHLDGSPLTFLKHVNTDTLAIVMLVAVALLSKPGDKAIVRTSSYQSYKDSPAYRQLQTTPECRGQSYQ
jgi:hypothetical protein